MDRFSRRSVLTKILPASLIAIVLPAYANSETQRGKTPPREVVDDQPHMQSALDSLRNAKRELDQATSDKGGHRVRALRLVNQAIGEVERGVRYDRRH
jgi:hypothetical protein